MKQQTIVTTAAALVAAGGIAFGGASLAQAGNTTPTSYSSAQATGAPAAGRGLGARLGLGQGAGQGAGKVDPGKLKDLIAQHGLTGDTAVKVTQAATAKEPTAYLLRVWKATDGTYRAHMMRPDGTRIILVIDGNFSVTSVDNAPVRGAGKDKPAATSTPSAT